MSKKNKTKWIPSADWMILYLGQKSSDLYSVVILKTQGLDNKAYSTSAIDGEQGI